MIIGIDPKVDYAFKCVFGRERTSPLLAHLTNSVLVRPESHRISNLELKPTISISFLDHVLFPQTTEYHLCFRLLDAKRDICFSDDIELHIIELPKFNLQPAELTTDLDVWLYFLRNAGMMDTEHLPEAMRQRPMVMQALEELAMLAQTEQERERYEARRKAQLDYNTGLKVARLEGLMEGEIGKIHMCERLLNRPETSAQELSAMTLDDLTGLANRLEQQLRNMQKG